jgi:hypothetical protein
VTRTAVFLLAALLAGEVRADPAGDAREREARALLAAGYWPPGVSAGLAQASGAATRPAGEVARDHAAGDPRMQREGTAPVPKGNDGPAGGPTLTAAAHEAALKIARLDASLDELGRLAVDLEVAGVDAVRVASGVQRPALLRPILLFLVQAGVLTAAEAREFESAASLSALLERIHDRLERTRAERAALLIRRMVAVESSGH